MRKAQPTGEAQPRSKLFATMVEILSDEELQEILGGTVTLMTVPEGSTVANRMYQAVSAEMAIQGRPRKIQA